MGERRVQLGDLNRPPAGAAADARAEPTCRSRAPSDPRLDPVRERRDPGRPLAQLARPLAGREDDDRGAVADRRAVVRPQRVGDVGRAEQFLDSTSPDTCAAGFETAAARQRAATSAMSFSVHSPASMPSRACSAATDTESGHSGATRYGSSCSASTRRSSAPDDLPNP